MLKAIVIGNVGVVKFHQSGSTQVLSATVASNERRGTKTFTNWVTLKFWGERAAKLKDSVKKGRKVYAEGRPEAEAYARKNGTPDAIQTIHVEGDFLFLDAAPESVKKGKKSPPPTGEEGNNETPE